MPELETLETVANYTPSDGEVVTFYAEENGKVVMQSQKPDGTVETILEGN